MHPQEYTEIERICCERGAHGAVLEIGAVPSDDSLLCMSCLAAATQKIGIGLDPPARYRDFEILQMNAHAMDYFPDRYFDTVLCSSVLEHDPFFWKTLAEIRRVARAGALVVICVPGYAEVPTGWARWLRRAHRLLRMHGRLRRTLDSLLASTPTLVVHRYPGDYYRFSHQAVGEVICDGLLEVQIQRHLLPPRFIASGIMP